MSGRARKPKTTRCANLSSLEIVWCETQANLFDLAWQKGYYMNDFVSQFMQSEVAAHFDSEYSRFQWLGELYMLHHVARECRLVPDEHRDYVDPEAIHWAGYVYRFWHLFTGESSREIFSQAGYPYILGVFEGYHTLSCEMAVGRMKEHAERMKG